MPRAPLFARSAAPAMPATPSTSVRRDIAVPCPRSALSRDMTHSAPARLMLFFMLLRGARFARQAVKCASPARHLRNVVYRAMPPCDAAAYAVGVEPSMSPDAMLVYARLCRSRHVLLLFFFS